MASAKNLPQNPSPGTSFSPSAPEVQQLFNRIAPVYDRLNDQLSFGLHRVWKRMAVKWSAAKAGDRVLDLCCGTGDLALLLAQAVGHQGEVYGVDFACDLLAVAAERTQQQWPSDDRAPIHWQVGDALQLDFPANHFDAITLGYGLRNVTDIPQTFKELYRVLKPGAKGAILDMHRPQDISLRQFQRWYLEALVVPSATRLGLREEYVYINPSLDRFPRGPEQVALAKASGFQQVTHYPIALGMMGVLLLQKPDH